MPLTVPEKASNIECKNPTVCPELKKSDMKWYKRLQEYTKETWHFKSKITVEPIVVCYILPSVLGGLAVQNLCLEKACKVNLNYDNITCKHIMLRNVSDSILQEDKFVTMKVTDMTAWSHPLHTALAGIFMVFLGAWSDRTGNRKSLMILPLIGKLASTLGLILSVIFFFQLGVDETAVIEGLPPALTGGRIAVTMAAYSYVTDITSDSERTFRLGIITALLTLSRPIGLALSGYMTVRLGYNIIFSIACVFYLTGFLYAVIRLKTTTNIRVENKKGKRCCSVFQISDLVATVNVAVKKRDSSRRLQMFLIIIAYMLLVGPVLGEAQITYWFTRDKFKFTEIDYSLFLAYSAVFGIIGSFILVYLFSKRWNIDDSIIGLIACCSRFAASLVYALAPTRTIYFLGPILDLFSSGAATSLRSMATKLVRKEETGKTSSLISISEALVTVIYSPIYSKVYKKCLKLNAFLGLFYIISAILAIFAIGIFIALHILRKKEAREKCTKEEMTKLNSKDSKITHL